MVASNMPDIFICNTGYNPVYPKPGIIDFHKGIDATLLKKMGIKYLVFQTKGGPDVEMLNSILNASKALQKINQIGEWGVFALR